MPPSESPHSEFTGPDAGRAWRAGPPGTPARVRCLKRTRARRAGLLWGGLRCKVKASEWPNVATGIGGSWIRIQTARDGDGDGARSWADSG